MGGVLCKPRQCGEAEQSAGGMAVVPCATDTQGFHHHFQWWWRAHVTSHVLAASAQQTCSWRICSLCCFAIPLLYTMNKLVRKLLALSICLSCTGWRAINDHVFKSHLWMLLIGGITWLHKSVVLAPHWLDLTQQLLCVLLAFRRERGQIHYCWSALAQLPWRHSSLM